LIEILAVITIIGVLASLTVGVAGLVSRKNKVARTKAELARIDLAIRNYESKLGFYPPDNLLDPTNLWVDPNLNQLYYELTGAVYDRASDAYQVGATSEQISRQAYQAVFGNNQNVAGIYNSSESKANIVNFLSGSRAGQTEHVNESPHVDVLVAPVRWPLNHSKSRPGGGFDPRFIAPFPGSDANPWRYVSSNPTNNPGEFDLWAEIVIGDEIVVIGNWEEK